MIGQIVIEQVKDGEKLIYMPLILEVQYESYYLTCIRGRLKGAVKIK